MSAHYLMRKPGTGRMYVPSDKLEKYLKDGWIIVERPSAADVAAEARQPRKLSAAEKKAAEKKAKADAKAAEKKAKAEAAGEPGADEGEDPGDESVDEVDEAVEEIERRKNAE